MLRSKNMQAGKTEEEEMRQQQRMKTMTEIMRKIQAKGTMNAYNSWWVSELLAADCKKRGSIKSGRTQCISCTAGCIS